MIEKIKYYAKSFKIKIGELAIVLNYEKPTNTKVKNLLKNPKRVINVLRGKEINVNYIEVVLTTFCNLKCKGCSALMNYYNKPYHLELNRIIKSIQNLTNSCDSINHLRLIGGEPFCYPNLADILLYLQKQDKVKKVAIVTNGTLLIDNKSVLEILKNNKFYISISNYGRVSSKYEDLIQQLIENNIQYELMSNSFKWTDYGDFNKRNRKPRILKKQYLMCNNKKMSLLDGKLFHCFRCSHATNLKLIDLKKKDYIELLDDNIETKILRRKIYDFIYKYVPYIESCDYCDCQKDKKEIPRGVQIK